MNNEIPTQLRTAFENKKLIPIVAAGVSMSIKNKKGEKIFPSWPELLELAADQLIEENKQIFADGIKAMLALKKYKEAASIAKDGLTGGLWNKFFNRVFNINSDDIDPTTISLPKAIWTLSDRIITLNYERIMRIACPRPLDLQELDNTNKSRLVDFNRNTLANPAVWHLHGKIDNIEKIIFTSDSYCKLYLEHDHEYKAALETFRAMCSTNNLLFIGCSLDDTELLLQLDSIHEIFSGNTGPHYVLVRQSDSELIRTKLKNFPVFEIICFSDFGQPLLDLIYNITTINEPTTFDKPTLFSQPNKTENPSKTVNSENKRIAILSANPISESNDYSELIKAFKSFKCEITFFPLTTKSLNELDDFKYIFIVSSLIKNQIVIEDEALQSARIGFKDLEGNIGNSNTDGVFIFLNYEEKLNSDEILSDINTLSLPTLIFPTLIKEQINSLGFKLFKKGELNYIKNSTIINSDKFKLGEFKGKYSTVKKQTPLPDAIDQKTTRHYVGRKTDLQNICREIINLKDKNEVLTIKGSGGIGKTITIKKIVVALAERNQFSDGIDFIDCEFISDYLSFTKKIATNFNLENAVDITAGIKSNFIKQNKLIILDNIETLLYLDEAQKIKDFIYFICDYASIVTTSRELLNLDCEQVYELRNFSTDEAYDLFVQQLDCDAFNKKERHFIRQEIVDKLLDNNPLAISIIANNIPKGKNLINLKQELENDIFRKVSDAELFEFDRTSDYNIERKKSLYASINFSYLHLSISEKMAFELLSLFPDGINMEHLKRIAANSREKMRTPEIKRYTGANQKNKYTSSMITDTVIKSLENKSMTQVDNCTIKLQSIVGKFAEHQLKKRTPNELDQFYQSAIEYNMGFSSILTRSFGVNRQKIAKLFNKNKTNFFKSIEYIRATTLSDDKLIDYLDDLQHLAITTTNCSTLMQELEKNMPLFPENGTAQLGFDLILLNTKYYSGYFEKSLSKLQEILPKEALSNLKKGTIIENIIKRTASDIYAMEGDMVLGALCDIELKYVHGYAYPITLYSLGVFSQELLINCNTTNFFTMEATSAINGLSLKKIDEYIEYIYENNHLELMQANYLKAKICLNEKKKIDKEKVEKLVIVNPYTLGLQQLMLAFIADDVKDKIELFEKALNNLKHIHYYYVEALLLYARSLQILQHPHYAKIYQQGLDLASRNYYRWLRYQFEDLAKKKTGTYCATDYPLPKTLDLDHYVNFLIKENQRH